MSFTPIPLPSSGFQLIEGQQYVMDKYTRNAVREEYGFFVPQTATCLYARRYAERAFYKVENLETHEVREWQEERPAVLATFFFLSTASKRVKFCISCEALAEVRALNAEADKYTEERTTNTTKTHVRTPKEKKIDVAIASLIDML